MTVKAGEIVVDALELLVVQADEAPIEPSEMGSCLRALNDMMIAWAAQGIDLGFTQVVNAGSEMTVPLGALKGIKANLAVDISPIYEVDPSPSLMRKARTGYSACVDLVLEQSPIEYPETLPRGSGTAEPGTKQFYDEPEGTALTETGGSIGLESETEEA